MPTRGQLSPVAIAVLALLTEGPMHAYRMQQLIKERGVDVVVNVRNRSGLHAATDRLARDELIRVHSVERDARHPERTVYELTREGRDALLAGLRDNMATPAEEFPLFPAVVSFLHLLSSTETHEHLTLRATALRRQLAAIQTMINASNEYHVPRLHLLEHEYRLAITTAELDWVTGVLRDITEDELSWQPYFPSTNQP